MAFNKLSELQQLAYDVYKGNTNNFSKEEGQEAIRGAILDAIGGEWSYYNFQRNKYDVYQILSEVLSISTGEILTSQFDRFAEVKDLALGDQNTFIIEDTSLFDVATIASSTNDLRRQKLYSNRLTVETEEEGVKIYAEFNQFMAGRIDFASMINRVSLSIAHKTGTRIYNGIYDSYASLSAPYGVTGTYSEATLADIIAHVEASTGKKASVFGTKKALGKITLSQYAEKTKEQLNELGYVGKFKGTDVLELPQVHKAGTHEFLVNDDFLLIIPSDEKIVKIVLEGQAFVDDVKDGGARNDRQIEFLLSRRIGVGVIKSSVYGIYKIS